MIPTTLADVYCSASSATSSDQEQSEMDAVSRGSPDSRYTTSPGLLHDTLIDNAGKST